MDDLEKRLKLLFLQYEVEQEPLTPQQLINLFYEVGRMLKMDANWYPYTGGGEPEFVLQLGKRRI